MIVLNPRRKTWNPNLTHSVEQGSDFRNRVEWEITAQEHASLRLYYFAKDSKSPITLLELGLYGKDMPTIVYCPKEFYRYGNVKIVCSHYKIALVETEEKLHEALTKIFLEE